MNPVSFKFMDVAFDLNASIDEFALTSIYRIDIDSTIICSVVFALTWHLLITGTFSLINTDFFKSLNHLHIVALQMLNMRSFYHASGSRMSSSKAMNLVALTKSRTILGQLAEAATAST